MPKKSSYQQKYENILEENKELETKTREKHDPIKFLNDKIWNFEEIEKKHDDYAEKLHKLFELGIIIEDGDPIRNGMN